MTRGYFGIGIYHPKKSVNVGTLWRTAYQLGAAFIYTIGERYEKQSSDTMAAYRHIPLHQYQDFGAFQVSRIYDCPLIGIEMGGVCLGEFKHSERAIYLLGAEDYGLPDVVRSACNTIVSLEAVRQLSYNVAVAGALVMYDRLTKRSVGIPTA